MRFSTGLFARNRAWAAARTRQDPRFFERLCEIQSPAYMWIGCADSRVPANEIVGLDPGEMFVHRNVANIVTPDNANCLSAVQQYAVDTLRVGHIIVCGHYGCGGVKAALGDPTEEPLERWLASIRVVRRAHAGALDAIGDAGERWRRLCELNVIAQVATVRRLPMVEGEAWMRGTAPGRPRLDLRSSTTACCAT